MSGAGGFSAGIECHMSRNRNETRCACGLWDFASDHGTAAINDPTLLTSDEYWSPHFRAFDRGYGFRENCHGNVYHWVQRRDGRVVSICNSPVPGWDRELAWTYAVPSKRDRYRWRRLECPLCRRIFAGWYVQQPASLHPPVYELYDTSYFHAQNDEPAPEDIANLIEWTPAMLADAAREYLARREACRERAGK